jgi:hypothetical protein
MTTGGISPLRRHMIEDMTVNCPAIGCFRGRGGEKLLDRPLLMRRA